MEQHKGYNRCLSKACLPSAWQTEVGDIRSGNALRHLKVKDLSVKYIGPGKEDSDAASIRTNHPVPMDCPLYYFEVTVLNAGSEGLIGIGFSANNVNLQRLPGWEPNSYGYHGDDGFIFPGVGRGQQYGPKFTEGDVVGALWNRAERTISYTKNGIGLGVAFERVSDDAVLFPTVGFRTKEEEVRANFGNEEFVIDFDSIWTEQCQRIMKGISVSGLPTIGGLGRSGAVAENILEYLIHHRYWKTAAVVARDLLGESRDLNADVQNGIAARQKIYEAVLSGNIDEALSQTEAAAPGALEKHPRILFKLRCQKFMQMLQGGEEDAHNALQFGRTFLTPSCATPEDQVFLSEVLTLIAYDDPAHSPCGHLLKPEYRRELADELNSAILEQQGRSKRSSLETLYEQLIVSVEELKNCGDLQCRFFDFRKLLTDGLPEAKSKPHPQ
ncbi:hypothetical protein BSKO_13842 [Bryopsis sp. KO-2023]|nr:hypothetical protein BSKO_13842 [Bryopsis sp. KO-2023]